MAKHKETFGRHPEDITLRQVHSRLSPAFHEDFIRQIDLLKDLEQKYPEISWLRRYHLNWIPTTFEIIGELDTASSYK